jgi:hypothetical protein
VVELQIEGTTIGSAGDEPERDLLAETQPVQQPLPRVVIRPLPRADEEFSHVDDAMAQRVEVVADAEGGEGQDLLGVAVEASSEVRCSLPELVLVIPCDRIGVFEADLAGHHRVR